MHYDTRNNLLPVVNNVNIPGVKNVCLVLIDETSQTCCNSVKMTIERTSITITVWKGNSVVNPVDMWPVWNAFWKTENIPGIRRDTTLAHSEICTRLGDSDTCGTSLFILSELYGQWYGGIAPQNKINSPIPDYDLVPYGSWTYGSWTWISFG